jgi:hypothetical protein
MIRVRDQIALRPAWKENLYSLLVVAIIVGASVIFFFEASSIGDLAVHTRNAAVTAVSQTQR